MQTGLASTLARRQAMVFWYPRRVGDHPLVSGSRYFGEGRQKGRQGTLYYVAWPHVVDAVIEARTALVCRCCLPPWRMREAAVLRKTRNQCDSSLKPDDLLS